MQTLKARPFPGAVWIMDARTAPVPVPVPPVVTPPAPPPAPPPSPTPSPSHTGTITFTAIPDRQPFPWDAPFSGTLDGWDPAKFNTGSGFASFTVKLSQDAPGIWLRPHSGTDPAADPAKPGTGAVLRAPLQVSGPVKAGTVTVRAQVPHGFEWFLADFDTDPGMANAARLPSRFGISFHGSGAGTSHAFRYMQDGYATDAAHPAPNPPDFMAINPFGVVNGTEQSGGDADWHLPGEGGSGCNSFYAAKILDRLCKETGGIVSFAPFAMNGGSTGNYQVNDLAHTYGSLQAAIKRVARTHWFVWIFGPNDKAMFSSDHSASLMTRLMQAVRRDGNNPDVLFSICSSPLWDGGQLGFLEGHLANETVEQAFPDRAVFMRSFDAGCYWSQNGHATQWGRARYADAQAQGVLALFDKLRGLPPRSTGPRVLSATRDGKLIRVKLSDKVHVVGWSEGATAPRMLELDTTATPVPPEALASIPDIFPAGGTDGARLPIASVTIVNDAPGGPELQIPDMLGSDLTKAGEFWWGMMLTNGDSFHKVPGNYVLALKDAAGMDLQRSIRPVPIVPVNAPPSTLALDTPPDLIAGARARIGGTGSGLPVSTVPVAVNGATPITPDELMVMADNTWSGIVPMPATPGPATLALPNGPTITVNVRAPRDRLPASYRDKVVGYYRADNGLYADRAGNTSTAKMGSVLRWRDMIGGVGDLVGFNDDADAAPLLDVNRRSWGATGGYRFRDPRAFRSSLNFEMASSPSGSGRHLGVRNPAMATALGGDLTLVFVIDGNPAGLFSGWFQLGNTTDAWGWDSNAQPGFTGGGAGIPNLSYGASQVTLPKAPNYGNVYVVRWNATSRLLRFRSHEGEASGTVSTSVIPPINSLRVGSSVWQNRLLPCWMRLAELQMIGAELTDDQVSADLANYTKVEWLS